MNDDATSYHAYRFPPLIISHAVWLYHRFCLSFRDAEDLLAQRGITVSYETIRQWCSDIRSGVRGRSGRDVFLNNDGTHTSRDGYALLSAT